MQLPSTRTLRHGLLAAIVALLAFAPATAMAHHRGHFGSPHRHHGHARHWHRGYWYHGWHGRRFGWWWVVGPSYYFYETVQGHTSAPVVAPVGPPPAQNWYLCEDSGYYYPHVRECASGWTVVPVTPPRQ